MRRLIFCCDGTWNHIEGEHPTNVLRLAKAIPPTADGITQMVFYIEGVGTGRGTGLLARKIDRLGGGMFGWGLLSNIVSAYKQLIFNYQPGDEIYIFGFSRGAYTARSLAGLIRSVGIVERDKIGILPQAIDRYRRRGKLGHPDAPDNCAFRWANSRSLTTGDKEREWRQRIYPQEDHSSTLPLKIIYLGVWDTVGALGVPNFLLISRLFNWRHKFHDFQLSRSVAAARHAVALDERRATFPAALWKNLDDLNGEDALHAPRYQQVWFPGGHGSVGGGGDVTGLSHDAMAWLVEGAIEHGLAVKEGFLQEVRKEADHNAPLNNVSKEKWTFTSWAMSLIKRDREGPQTLSDVSLAARRRWRDGPYRPASLQRVSADLQKWRED